MLLSANRTETDPQDLTWNRKPDRNQTADLTRNRNRTAANRVSPSIFSRDNVKTITANHLNPWFLKTVTICNEQKSVP